MKEGESRESSRSRWAAAPRGTVAGLSRPSSRREWSSGKWELVGRRSRFGVRPTSRKGQQQRRRSHVKGPLAALPSRRRARPVAVVAGSFKRARKARDATTAETALWIDVHSFYIHIKYLYTQHVNCAFTTHTNMYNRSRSRILQLPSRLTLAKRRMISLPVCQCVGSLVSYNISPPLQGSYT